MTLLMVRPASSCRAGPIAGAKRECQVANKRAACLMRRRDQRREFADRGARRLLQQHMLARGERGYRLRMTHLRRRAQRDRIDLRPVAQQLLQITEMRQAGRVLAGSTTATNAAPEVLAIAGTCCLCAISPKPTMAMRSRSLMAVLALSTAPVG